MMAHQEFCATLVRTGPLFGLSPQRRFAASGGPPG